MVTIKDKLNISVVDNQDDYDEKYLIHSTFQLHDPSASLEHFGLTSYHSQLLVVGGKTRGKVTNKVWTSDNATDWQSSLPPMPNRRCFPLATNTGPSLECVIVAGGSAQDHKILTTLEVLLDEQWFTVLTTPIFLAHFSVHNGVAYFNAKQKSKYLPGMCRIESLLAARLQSHDKSHTPRLDLQLKQISLSTGKQPSRIFGQIITSHNEVYLLHNKLIDTCSYSTPALQQYVYVGDLLKCI